MGLSPERTRASPFATFSMPSVAMNDGILSFATSVPFTRPARAPVPMPAATPSGMGSPHSVMKIAVMTAESVITVPTERSMPPVMITNVTPRASTPFTLVAMRMPTMLSNWRKLGDRSEKTIMMTISAANASSRWTAPERTRLRRRTGVSAMGPIFMRPAAPRSPRSASWRRS